MRIGDFRVRAADSRAGSPTGAIAGHVYSPATKEYVRSADVRLVGTNQVTSTESDGSFRFHNVPAGPVTITVSYSGYMTATDSFTVSPGQTATREISLTSTLAGGEAIQMSQFVVASDREGNAKAIMDQRRDMNISTSVASDIYGDLTDGNVGEFLKFQPGLDIEYIQSEAAACDSEEWIRSMRGSRSTA